MIKKRKDMRVLKKPKSVSEDEFFDFILGVVLFFIIELIFMLGGLYIEKKILGIQATGIPSLLGLLVWFIASMIYTKKKLLFLGGLTTSILVPIILIIVTITQFVSFNNIMYYSITLFIILEIILLLILSKNKN